MKYLPMLLLCVLVLFLLKKRFFDTTDYKALLEEGAIIVDVRSPAEFSGGNIENPTYESVCTGSTEHVEVVKVTFDNNIISYEDILDFFWLCHDPTQLDRQGLDIGRQYRSVIFYYNDDQKIIALNSKKQKQLFFSTPIVTEISPIKKFYLAEDYHQLYIQKKSLI